jgi:hypothetical protein
LPKRIRETLLGLVVLGLVAAGVYWVRVRPSPMAGAVGEPRATAEATPEPGEPASERADSADRGSDSSAEAALPDITLADGTVDLGDVRVVLSVAPRPPVAFAKKRFRVRVTSGAAALPIEGGRISFEMRMPMGDHRYSLVAGADGWHEAEVVLPFCPSGNPRWYASVEGTVAGRPRLARFRIDLTKPR